MVGHTGNYEAAVEACMAVDVCLGKLIEEADANFYTVIVVADHGNAEDMIYENGEPRTSHTTSVVPFIIRDKKVELVEKGDLTMVAPTILTYMDIAVPKEMEETPLLLKNID
jgi:2,3-bisphosphoglycerate-independent phosphoglycerate mutase